MFTDAHYSSSTNPHRALIVMCTILVVALGFGLYAGWMRYFRLRLEREQWARSGELLERRQQEAARRSINLATGENNPTTEAVPTGSETKLEAILGASANALRNMPAGAHPTLADIANPGRDSLLDTFAVPEVLLGPLPAELIQEGTALVEQFSRTTAWKDRTAFVLDPDRVGPYMQDYYETRKALDPVVGQLLQTARFRLKNHEVFAFAHSSTRPGDKLELALVRDPSGKLKLDWESYVGWGEADFAKLKKERSTRPTLLRVYAKRGHYYNYEFTDESKFFAVQLFSPDMLSTVHAYCPKDSELASALHELFTRQIGPDPAAITVHVAYPAKAESDHVLHLTGLISNRWLVLP